jgi:hypothetical protein
MLEFGVPDNIMPTATFTPDQIALQEYLERLAEKTRQWVAEDPENRWAASPVSDPAHWAEYGVFTVDEFIKYDTIDLVYELTRSRYGFKPNYAELKKMSLEELSAEAKRLSEMTNDDF